MQCTSCHTDFNEHLLQRREGVFPYRRCASCTGIWLDAAASESLLAESAVNATQAADEPCPRCRNVLLESVQLALGETLDGFRCPSCRGLYLQSWHAVLDRMPDLPEHPFLEFLEGVGLVFQRERRQKKVNKLPSAFKVKQAKPTDYACPHCGAALTRYRVHDKQITSSAEFEICDACFGIWLDKEDMQARPNEGESTLTVNFESVVPSSRTCPKCRNTKLVALTFEGMETVIDCCPSCFGTWLDGGELSEFCEYLGKNDYDVINALVDNAIFRQPALCKMLKHFSRTLHELDSQVQEQEKNLAQARDIQIRLLFNSETPKTLMTRYFGPYEVVSFWQPAKTVGGDYFDLIKFHFNMEDYLCICIADVSGKGLPASLLMANFQALLRSFATTLPSSAELCARLNEILYHNTAPNKYITAFLGVLHTRLHQLTYTNAGHNPPLWLTGGKTTWLKDGGTVLGLFPQWDFRENTLTLAPRDRVLFYTDGVSEARRGEDEIGEEHLAELLTESGDLTVMAAQQKLVSEVKQFCLGDFHDDATMLLLERGQ